MRVGVLIRTWLSGLASFVAVTTAFCVALVVAITGPPNWSEMRGVSDSIGAAFDRVSTFANRQIDAYQQSRARAAPAPQVEQVEDAPPPRVMAQAPRVEEAPSFEAPPQSAEADDLAGGLDEPAPPIMRAPPTPRAAPAPQRTPQASRPQPPRTLATPRPAPPMQTVEIAPPVEPAVEREPASLTDQLMQAVEALIPTAEVSEETKPAIKDAEPDPYSDPPDQPRAAEAGNPEHADARRRARAWTPQPGDRFPVDERDLERWGGH